MKYTFENLSTRDTARLEQAKRIAAVSDCSNMHGAVGVKGGRVVGVGVNTVRNSPDTYETVPEDSRHVHAEDALLRAMGNNSRGATVFVARVNSSGEERISKPCSRCTILLKRAGVRRVVYTVSTGLELD